MTAAGIILGTAAYMAPEQAKGRSVDARADIWAFGCVLFEMLAGRAPFAGESVVDILSTVIQRDPDWSALPVHTPAALRRLLSRCLEKNPKHRLAAIADARLDLDEAARPPVGRRCACACSNPAPVDSHACGRWCPRPHDYRCVVGMVASVTRRSTDPGERGLRCRHSERRRSDLATLTDRFAVSPDGTMLVIVDHDYGGLALRHMSALELCRSRERRRAHPRLSSLLTASGSRSARTPA